MIFLFLILCVSADVVVRKIKIITSKLGLRLFALGLILGIVTTLPELAVGINAVLKDAVNVSVGNLIGGIIVILGLILGASLILNRKVETDGHVSVLIPEAILIFSPLLLGIDGKLDLRDGLVILILYVLLLYYLYRKNKRSSDIKLTKVRVEKISSALFLTIIGVITILAVSHWIMDVSINLIGRMGVSQFFVGLIFFSLGTNLPEISIALTAWRRRAAELSLSHLISSAITNIAVLGMLVIFKQATFFINMEYYLLMLFLGLILIMFIIFYHTNKNLNRTEGAVLLLIYFIFLVSNLFLWKRQVSL